MRSWRVLGADEQAHAEEEDVLMGTPWKVERVACQLDEVGEGEGEEGKGQDGKGVDAVNQAEGRKMSAEDSCV